VPRPDRSRDSLVATTAVLLRRQGYAATGTAQVLAESGVTTGSLYHHFPEGKEALAEAAVDAAGAEVGRLLEGILARPKSVSDAISTWTRALGSTLAQDPRDGCPVAPVALESIHASPRLRAASARAFESWRGILAARLLRDGWSTVEAEGTATAVLCLIEGALLLARTSGDPGPLEVAAQAAARLLHAGR
jgi:TetR/AcrR family transcriptional repressor of lmrAB and yxaGH operons